MSISELTLIEAKCVSGAGDGGEGGSNGNRNDPSAAAAEVNSDCGSCIAAGLATVGTSGAALVGAGISAAITCGECATSLYDFASNGPTVTDNANQSWQTQFESNWFGD